MRQTGTPMTSSIQLLEKYQNSEAARLVLMHAADYIYRRTVYGIHLDNGDREAIDLMDEIRADMQAEEENAAEEEKDQDARIRQTGRR